METKPRIVVEIEIGNIRIWKKSQNRIGTGLCSMEESKETTTVISVKYWVIYGKNIG